MRAEILQQEISQDIRAAAEAGMQGKAPEFQESGGEIYRPVTANP